MALCNPAAIACVIELKSHWTKGLNVCKDCDTAFKNSRRSSAGSCGICAAAGRGAKSERLHSPRAAAGPGSVGMKGGVLSDRCDRFGVPYGDIPNLGAKMGEGKANLLASDFDIV